MVKKTKRATYGEPFALPVGTAVFTQFIDKVNSSQGEFPSNKYEILVVWPKGTEFKELKARLMEVSQAHFGEDVSSLSDLDHIPLKSGNENMDTEKYPIFKDAIYATLKRSAKAGAPPIYDLYMKDNKLQPLEATKIYPGCKVKLFGSCGAAAVSGNKTCWIGLDAIQFAGDGDRLGGNNKAELQSLITSMSTQEEVADVLSAVVGNVEEDDDTAPIDIVASKSSKKAAKKKAPSMLDLI